MTDYEKQEWKANRSLGFGRPADRLLRVTRKAVGAMKGGAE